MANRRIRVRGGRDLEKWVSEYQGDTQVYLITPLVVTRLSSSLPTPAFS